MENRAYALAAGAFVLLLGIALIASVLWLNRDERIGGAPYVVTTTRPVSGLKVEAAVRFRGVDVGKVETIRFDPAEPGRVVVGITIDPDAPITRGTYAQLGFQGVTGLSFVQLDDDGSARERLATSAESPANIPMRPSLFDTGEGIVTALGEVADRMKKLLDEENQKVLVGMLAQIDTASAQAKKLAASLEPAAASLAPLLADTRVTVNDVRAAVNEARGAVKRAEIMVDSMTQLAARYEERAPALGQVGDNAADVGAAARALNDDTLPRLNVLADDLRHEVRVLDRVLTGLADQPDSIVFGLPPRRPGPGEAGFEAGR